MATKLNLPPIKKPIQAKEKMYIYWRWKKTGTSLSQSFIQKIVDSPHGQILELSDGISYTNYPNRVLRNEIFIALMTDKNN